MWRSSANLDKTWKRYAAPPVSWQLPNTIILTYAVREFPLWDMEWRIVAIQQL